MADHLILRLEGPLQAWGDVALDPRRPTLPFPSRSALAGLLANALGWRYRDAAQLTTLQDALRYAVREERSPTEVIDYQTAELDDANKDDGWTSWGQEDRGKGTQILWKHYLADGCFRVALTVSEGAPVTLDQLAEALRRPARPLFLGRKSCPPSGPVLEPLRVTAASPWEALRRLAPAGHDQPPFRCWCDVGEVPAEPGSVREVWDRRDFRSNRFVGSRRVVELELGAADLVLAAAAPEVPS